MKKGRRICKCECGGQVRGVESLGRLWTWCENCTPVVKVTARALEQLTTRGDG